MCDSVRNVIKSRPRGDETTLYTNSEINYPEEASLTFDLDKNFTEPIHTHNSVTPPMQIINEAFKCSELQNEMMATVYERAVDSEDISEIAEDIDTSLFELRSLEGEISNAHTISPMSVSVLDKTQNLTGELVSQIFGSRSRRNISSRIEELSRSFSISQGSEHFPPFTLRRCLPSPKHQVATVTTVEKRRNFVFVPRLVISGPSYATPLSKMILEPIPIRSATDGGYSNSSHAIQEGIPHNGPQSFAGNALHICGITQEDIAYCPINSANHEIVKNDGTESYQFDSGSVSFDWNVVQEMNEPSESVPPNRNCETIGSDLTISSISRVPISNFTHSSSYNEIIKSRNIEKNQKPANPVPDAFSGVGEMPSTDIEVCSSDVVRLMGDLKDWQKLVVQFECVLTWEKPLILFYIILVVTVFHALLWTFEPPFLVSVGCLSLSFSLWCYFGPKLTVRFLPSVPIADHNQRYRAFCRRILNARQLFISVYRHISGLAWSKTALC
ncbi:hypothetical protein ACTXT7_016118 [Hymenolepis weldensis]